VPVCGATRYVRFGSKADICAAIRHVRFTPDNDRESGFPHKVMSALPPKADVCSALAHVCFGPIADIRQWIGLLQTLPDEAMNLRRAQNGYSWRL
jgi:hypothetical protein